MPAAEAWKVVGLALVASILLAAGAWIIFQRRNTPDRRELKRRFFVNRDGRVGDALLLEAGSDSLVYQYQVNGVVYSASQDVQTLASYLPEEPDRLIGPVNIKYLVRNPANSIIVCEQWSGIRAAQMYQQQKQLLEEQQGRRQEQS
jgi:hypothetical protein